MIISPGVSTLWTSWTQRVLSFFFFLPLDIVDVRPSRSYHIVVILFQSSCTRIVFDESKVRGNRCANRRTGGRARERKLCCADFVDSDTILIRVCVRENMTQLSLCFYCCRSVIVNIIITTVIIVIMIMCKLRTTCTLNTETILIAKRAITIGFCVLSYSTAVLAADTTALVYEGLWQRDIIIIEKIKITNP